MTANDVLGIASMAASAAGCVAFIAWLCSRRAVWARRAGVALATGVAGYCGFVATILVVGNVDEGTSLRVAGSLAVLVFAITALGAVLSGRHGVSNMRSG